MTMTQAPTPGPLSSESVKLLVKLLDTLKPFAGVAEKLKHCHVVEICEPNPDNPSRNIIPMPREWFERAGDDLEYIAIQLHAAGVLSEGQASKVTGLDRVEVRREVDRLAPTAPPEEAAAQRDNEPLKTDDTGCVTKRFVIFNRPGMAPEKKGGWLKDEHLIAFLREAMLLDCWTPGSRATVLELTWNNDLWASSASEYLSAHDHAIGPRRARKAWREAREKHERIYKSAPSMPLGQEIATYHVRTSPFPPPATDATDAAAGVREATGAKAVIRNEQIVISIDVDALPGILSGSIATNSVAGLFKVTDPAEFAKEVCGALNAEKEDGSTRVHRMFDSAFNHAIDQGAEGVEEITEDEFEAEAQRIQSEALAALKSTVEERAEP